MMKKADKARLSAALDKAIAPPRRSRGMPTDILSEYAPPEKPDEKSGSNPPLRTIVPQTTVVRQTPEPLSETTVVPQTTVVRQTMVDGSKYTQTPNDIFDKVLPTLSVYAQAALLRLYRLSRGMQGAETCKIAYDTLARSCNSSKSQIIRAVKELETAGWVERAGADLAAKNKLSRGTIFRIMLPAATTRSSVRQATVVHQTTVVPQTTVVHQTPYKETHIKETHTNTGAPTGTSEKEIVRVCVLSRFTLAECRRYAESLRKDGITNPGGYATKIYRSGEADDLMTAFLAPSDASVAVDASQCPDCKGTGFREPGGAGKGVARCKHERMVKLC